MDDSNRESFVIDIDTSLPTKRVIRVLGWLVEFRGNSESIRLKNGHEFISDKTKSMVQSTRYSFVVHSASKTNTEYFYRTE